MKEQLQLNFAREIERDRDYVDDRGPVRKKLIAVVENNILTSIVGLVLLQAIGVVLFAILVFT